jgi:Tfp pilus assembly protein PilF
MLFRKASAHTDSRPPAPGRRSGLQVVLCILLTCVLVAPAAARRKPHRATDRWETEIQRVGLNPQEIPNPLAFTDEMRQTAREAAGSGRVQTQLERLQAHLFDTDAFVFNYNSTKTYTAKQAFEKREGNCVSFTNLFIALSRSIGLPTRAALLTEPGLFEQAGDLTIVNNHIVAIYEGTSGTIFFDFMLQREKPLYGVNVLEDTTVTAIHLNNLAVEHLVAGRPEKARNLLRKATTIDPEFSQALDNLGVVLRQLGDTEGAFSAYRQALDADPDHPVVLGNLAALYYSLGQVQQAEQALLASKLYGATPQLLVIRGDLELRRGELRKAIKLYKLAVRLDDNGMPEPLLALARAEIHRGHQRAAKVAILKILSIYPDNEAALTLLEQIRD